MTDRPRYRCFHCNARVPNGALHRVGIECRPRPAADALAALKRWKPKSPCDVFARFIAICAVASVAEKPAP